VKPRIAMTSAFDPPGIRLGVVRGISYGLFGKPGEFVPQARALGAGLIRAYLYWGQVEPEPGCYRWEAVDALLGQLTGDEEVRITLCSASPWGTWVPTDFQPQSPARDQGFASSGSRVRTSSSSVLGGFASDFECLPRYGSHSHGAGSVARGHIAPPRRRSREADTDAQSSTWPWVRQLAALTT
jgi:hypothetical protein